MPHPFQISPLTNHPKRDIIIVSIIRRTPMKVKYLFLLLAFLPIGALFLGANILYQDMLADKILPENIESLYDFVMCFPECQQLYGKHHGYSAGTDVFFYLIAFGISILSMLLAAGVGAIKGKFFHVLYFIIIGGTAGFCLHATFSSWELWFPGIILTCINIAHTALATAPAHGD